MNIFFDSSKIHNPHNQLEFVGYEYGKELTEINSSIDFATVTAQSFKPNFWQDIKNLFNQAVNKVFLDVQTDIITNRFDADVSVVKTTTRCNPHNTFGQSRCGQVLTEGYKGIAVQYKFENHNWAKSIAFQKLNLHLLKPVTGAKILIYDAKLNYHKEYKDLNFKAGDNDLLAMLQIDAPLILHSTASRGAMVLLDPLDFIVDDQSVLKNNDMNCPCNNQCRQEFDIYSVSDMYDTENGYRLVKPRQMEPTYGFEAVVTCVCDLNQIIDMYSNQYERANLVALKFMHIIASNLMSSDNANYKVVFGRKATAEDVIKYNDEYQSAKNDFCKRVIAQIKTSPKNDCIICRGGVVGHSGIAPR